MHTLLIHQAFVLPGEPGGTRHYELIQHARRKGHDFTVVTSNLSYLTGRPAVERTALVTTEVVDGISLLRAYTVPALHRSFVWRVVSFLSFMVTSVLAGLRARNVDLVMGTTPPIFQAVSAWCIAALRRKPFLLEVRDLWPEFAVDMGVLRNPVLIRLSRWLERFLYARATHILVNSPAYRTYLLDKGIAPEKVSVVPNGVDPTMFDPQSDGGSLREELRLNGRFVVTYTGALGLANDIDTILRAAYRLREDPDIHFLLVGDGKERKRLQALTAGLDLPNVTFTGSMPKARMPEVLAASDACVATLKNIPMFTTTYPNKVFDYMAAGRPTILAIDGVIREVVESAQGGVFVPPGDDMRLAEAVTEFAGARPAASACGTAARSYVVTHFDRAAQANKFTDLLQSLDGPCRES